MPHSYDPIKAALYSLEQKERARVDRTLAQKEVFADDSHMHSTREAVALGGFDAVRYALADKSDLPFLTNFGLDGAGPSSHDGALHDMRSSSFLPSLGFVRQDRVEKSVARVNHSPSLIGFGSGKFVPSEGNNVHLSSSLEQTCSLGNLRERSNKKNDLPGQSMLRPSTFAEYFSRNTQGSSSIIPPLVSDALIAAASESASTNAPHAQQLTAPTGEGPQQVNAMPTFTLNGESANTGSAECGTTMAGMQHILGMSPDAGYQSEQLRLGQEQLQKMLQLQQLEFQRQGLQMPQPNYVDHSSSLASAIGSGELPRAYEKADSHSATIEEIIMDLFDERSIDDNNFLLT